MPENTNDLFKPDPVIDEQYKKQLEIFFENKSRKSTLIDMGPLPPIYMTLGISDKELKTNGKTILKALGFEGKNKHIPQRTLENLLSLVYDPEAVLKSISKRHSYISVLKDKTENQEQIIAILSPSRNGHGFTFIPSVYEKHNFNRFFDKIYGEQKILYIKNKDSELWGRHQLPPRHSPEPYLNNILTKSDIVKRLMIKQGQGPSPERRNNNNKEITMSDEFESPESKNLSPKELAYQNATWQRKVISDALKNEELCCLPGKDGYADTTPALNLMNGNIYHGANLLYLKEHQRENGFPTGEYATKEQIDRAQKDMPDLIIRKGQKGVSLNISEQNEQTGEYEDKHIRLFNIAQLNKPKNFKEWVEQKRQEKQEEFWQSQYGTKYTAPEPKKKAPGPEISCTSTDPAKYLGQYLAAVSMGGRFKATPEQGKEFAQKMEAAMYEKTLTAKTGKNVGELVSNPFALSKIGVEASKECKEFMRSLRTDRKVDQKQELDLEQKQEHKRSRKR